MAQKSQKRRNPLKSGRYFNKQNNIDCVELKDIVAIPLNRVGISIYYGYEK